MVTEPNEARTLSQLLLLVLIENCKLRKRVLKLAERKERRRLAGPLRRKLAETAANLALRTRIGLLLTAKGITRTKVARTIGVTKSTVSDVLNGARGLPSSWLPYIADLLEVSVEALLAGLDWPASKRSHPRPERKPRARKPRQENDPERAVRMRLRMLLLAHSRTQTELARHIGIARSCVSQVLAGTMALPPAWMPRLSTFLHLTPEEILDDIPWRPRRT